MEVLYTTRLSVTKITNSPNGAAFFTAIGVTSQAFMTFISNHLCDWVQEEDGRHDRSHHAHRNLRCRATGYNIGTMRELFNGEVLGPVPYLASVERNLRNYSNQSVAQFAKSHFFTSNIREGHVQEPPTSGILGQRHYTRTKKAKNLVRQYRKRPWGTGSTHADSQIYQQKLWSAGKKMGENLDAKAWRTNRSRRKERKKVVQPPTSD